MRDGVWAQRQVSHQQECVPVASANICAQFKRCVVAGSCVVIQVAHAHTILHMTAVLLTYTHRPSEVDAAYARKTNMKA